MSNSTAICHILRHELAKRMRNPNYSLRSFARSLKISPATLSMLLNGKRNLSPKATQKIADILELDPKRRAAFLGQAISEDLQNTISLQAFETMANWQSYAILSLTKTKGFKPSYEWVARRLGVSALEVKNCVQNLQTLGLLKCTANAWTQVGGAIRFNNKNSTVLTRSFQKGIMKRALYSLENDPKEIRDMSSITFAVDPKQIEEIKQKIKVFRRELADTAQLSPNLQEVYTLSIQLFPFTQRS